ncbi:GNAT family N-acetyltransferase [Oceanobacillus sp. M65]|uniref:GNAT family N-acetyltransferase n=1 Tax=Oceanobacillus sp. M65 TaxID=3457435 RepID=UPI003FCCA9A3
MFRLATSSDLLKISLIVKQIVVEMSSSNNRQWDETYPLPEDFLQDINTKSLYVLEEDAQLKGVISINEDFPPEYKDLNWKSEVFLVIHRLAVNPANRKEGVGMMLMQFAEQVAKERGIKFLISDTSELNTGMNRLFSKLQYKKVGQIQLGEKEFRFNGYEKEID